MGLESFKEQNEEMYKRREEINNYFISLVNSWGDNNQAENNNLTHDKLTKEDIQEARGLIEKDFENLNLQQKNLIDEVLEKTSYKKGVIKKERVYLPMPTHPEVLGNKGISLKTYGAIILESNFGGNFRNMNDRYIYVKKLDEIIDDIAKEISIAGKSVSVRTIKKYIKKLSKCDINIFELLSNKEGDLYYKLNYATEDKYYTLIHDKALRKLLNAYSENALRIYLTILFTCFDSIDKESGEISYKEKHIDQAYLCSKIGLQTSSRKIVTDCIEALAKGGFIKVRLEYKVNYESKDGNVINYPIPRYYYSISHDYLKKNHILKSRKSDV